jgi:hypothetical protein
VEHDEQGEGLEAEAKRMEEHSDEVGEGIEETRQDWESRKNDPSVPGAQPAPGEQQEREADAGEHEQRSGD